MANGIPIYDEVLQRDEYILRSDAVDALAYFDEKSPTGKTAKEIIADIPAADVVEEKHGEWIEDEDGDGRHCSVCGEDYCYIISHCEKYKYCPTCGAKMS